MQARYETKKTKTTPSICRGHVEKYNNNNMSAKSAMMVEREREKVCLLMFIFCSCMAP